jgi:hypothetical protein
MVRFRRLNANFARRDSMKLNETSQVLSLLVPTYVNERFLHWGCFCVNDQKRYPILVTCDVELSTFELLKRSGHDVAQGIRPRL